MASTFFTPLVRLLPSHSAARAYLWSASIQASFAKPNRDLGPRMFSPSPTAAALLHRRQIECGAQPAHAPSIEHRVFCRAEKTGMRREFGDALVERDRAAAGNEAVAFALGTSH